MRPMLQRQVSKTSAEKSKEGWELQKYQHKLHHHIITQKSVIPQRHNSLIQILNYKISNPVSEERWGGTEYQVKNILLQSAPSPFTSAHENSQGNLQLTLYYTFHYEPVFWCLSSVKCKQFWVPFYLPSVALKVTQP